MKTLPRVPSEEEKNDMTKCPTSKQGAIYRFCNSAHQAKLEWKCVWKPMKQHFYNVCCQGLLAHLSDVRVRDVIAIVKNAVRS